MTLLFKNLSIRLKLFFAYTVMFLAILSLSFYLLFFHVRGSLEQKIKDELNHSNQTITDMIETTATVSIKNHLRAIAEKNREIAMHFHSKVLDGEITESDARKQAVQVLLSQTVGDTGYLYCINSKGIAVVHPQAGVLGNDFSYRAFIKRQIAEKEGYLEYEWKNPGETRERPKALYMTYFEPWDWIISVSSYKSEFIKLIDIDDFRDRILRMTFGETGYSFILNSQGQMIVHPEVTGNLIDLRDTNGFPVVREMIRLKKGYLTYWWENPSETHPREKFVAFDYIPDFDWIIASSSYTSEVFSTLYEMQKIFLVILILVILVTGSVTLKISTTITNPLSDFIHQLEKSGSYDWSSRLNHEGEDEIGKLSTSFNRFMERLDQYRKKLVSEIAVRKKTEQDLYHLKNYLANIIDSMPSILIGMDRKGRITQWNQKAQEVTGVSQKAAKGKSFEDVFPRLSDKLDLINKAIVERHICSDSRHIRWEDEQIYYEDVTIYPLTANGVEGAVIRIDDVTEQVRLEEMMVQSEKMLSVGGLAAGMAHEINNPLSGIMQTANVMKTRLGDINMPANLKIADEVGISMDQIKAFMDKRSIPRMLDAINESGQRVAEIVGNMFSFARKSDTIVSQHHPAQLMDRIIEIAATDYDLKKQYDFKTIKIIKEYEENLPMIPCEGAKIQQVLLNILRNGAQAMQSQKINNYIPCFVLRLLKEEKMLRIEIEDNGPGMDESTQSRIFEPFFTTKPVGLGTGLGLSVSYFIITQNHLGTLDVMSSLGKGANFIIRLPLEKSEN